MGGSRVLTVAVFQRRHASIGLEIAVKRGGSVEAQRGGDARHRGLGALELRLGVEDNHVADDFLRRLPGGFAYHVAKVRQGEFGLVGIETDFVLVGSP